MAGLLSASFPLIAAAQDNVKIGFLLKTMQEARYQTDKSLFIARAESQGADVIFDSSGNDPLRQLQQVEEMLDLGVDVLVLQPVNTATAGALVDLAHDQGVKVVGYDSMLQDGPLDVMVMQDSWAVGQLQADAMVDWLNDTRGEVKGRVALIRGQPGDANAEALSSGVLKVVGEHPGLELVADRSHVEWSPDMARDTVENLLVEYDNDIDAFIANNSGLAFGVLAALSDEDLASADQVFVAGSDADLRNVQMVASDVQALEIWKQIKPLAYAAADVAVKIAHAPEADVSDLITNYSLIDNGYAEIPTIITPVFAVSKDTIDATVIEGGFYTIEQVYPD
ncbi:substrate-binding domain-containing protein [Ruegeria sp. 2205SS24-7]|uniref:substrate-binding domain-containing protein n=1 Tax=Ruegeria discodermiae TaxID=3064389 RepID=UPI00274060F6|nr:substrate-binding domain-containing protein [Ruegeria sp. 2205SS24-7]MDP5220227.1 substrate-binding domain-containing protein [Ruegeria sp. 2205SS24-7]